MTRISGSGSRMRGQPMELRTVSTVLEPLRLEARAALSRLSTDDPALADWMLAAARLDAALDATERLLAVHDPTLGRRRWTSRPVLTPEARRSPDLLA